MNSGNNINESDSEYTDEDQPASSIPQNPIQKDAPYDSENNYI